MLYFYPHRLTRYVLLGMRAAAKESIDDAWPVRVGMKSQARTRRHSGPPKGDIPQTNQGRHFLVSAPTNFLEGAQNRTAGQLGRPPTNLACCVRQGLRDVIRLTWATGTRHAIQSTRSIGIDSRSKYFCRPSLVGDHDPS